MGLDERAFFTERPEQRSGRYVCPRCRRTNGSGCTVDAAPARTGRRPTPTLPIAPSSKSSATTSSGSTAELACLRRAASASRSVDALAGVVDQLEGLPRWTTRTIERAPPEPRLMHPGTIRDRTGGSTQVRRPHVSGKATLLPKRGDDQVGGAEQRPPRAIDGHRGAASTVRASQDDRVPDQGVPARQSSRRCAVPARVPAGCRQMVARSTRAAATVGRPPAPGRRRAPRQRSVAW